MLQNAYLLAKIGADTAENEQHFAKQLRKTDYPTGPERPPQAEADRRGEPAGEDDDRQAGPERAVVSTTFVRALDLSSCLTTCGQPLENYSSAVSKPSMYRSHVYFSTSLGACLLTDCIPFLFFFFPFVMLPNAENMKKIAENVDER